jgi:major membrane immunogen (membrane-anchored lipoprotein)
MLVAQTGTSNMLGRRRARSAAAALLGGAVLASLTLLAACGDSNKPSETDITGTWNLTLSVSNPDFNDCNSNVKISFQQSGTTFTGQIISGTSSCGNVTPGAITGGTITGTTVTFSDGSCNYTGTVSGSPSNQMQGTVTCTLKDQSGQNVPFTGTWNASKS